MTRNGNSLQWREKNGSTDAEELEKQLGCESRATDSRPTAEKKGKNKVQGLSRHTNIRSYKGKYRQMAVDEAMSMAGTKPS